MSKLYNRIASVKIFNGTPAFIPSSYKDNRMVNSDETISLVVFIFSLDKETESFDIITMRSVEKSIGRIILLHLIKFLMEYQILSHLHIKMKK